MGLYYHITVGLLRVYISPNKYKFTVCILFHCHLLPKENTSTQTLFSELFVSKDWEFYYLTHWTSACVYTTAGLHHPVKAGHTVNNYTQWGYITISLWGY